MHRNETRAKKTALKINDFIFRYFENKSTRIALYFVDFYIPPELNAIAFFINFHHASQSLSNEDKKKIVENALKICSENKLSVNAIYVLKHHSASFVEKMKKKIGLSNRIIKLFAQNIISMQSNLLDPNFYQKNKIERMEALSSIFFDELLFNQAFKTQFPSIEIDAATPKCELLTACYKQLSKQRDQIMSSIHLCLVSVRTAVILFFLEDTGCAFSEMDSLGYDPAISPFDAIIKVTAGQFTFNPEKFIIRFNQHSCSSDKKITFLTDLEHQITVNHKHLSSISKKVNTLFTQFETLHHIAQKIKKGFQGIDHESQIILMDHLNIDFPGEAKEFCLKLSIFKQMTRSFELNNHIDALTYKFEKLRYFINLFLIAYIKKNTKAPVLDEALAPIPDESSDESLEPVSNKSFSHASSSYLFFSTPKLNASGAIRKNAFEVTQFNQKQSVLSFCFNSEPKFYYCFEQCGESTDRFKKFEEIFFDFITNNEPFDDTHAPIVLLEASHAMIIQSADPEKNLLCIPHQIDESNEWLYLPHELISKEKMAFLKDDPKQLQRLTMLVQETVSVMKEPPSTSYRQNSF